MTPSPYFADDHVELYLGDMREVLPALGVRADAVITDPPYGETSLVWDRWPDGWVTALGDVTNALWCFGSLKMFTQHWPDFAGWKLTQDVVWEKHNGSGFTTDRFRRVHELVIQLYRGRWSELYKDPPRIPYDGPDNSRKNKRGAGQAPHKGAIGGGGYAAEDRQARSVIWARSCNGTAIHPTEKPSEILAPLIRYSVPVGGLVLDPFAGSGSTLLTARSLGRRAIGIEADERYCEAAARRLSEADLFATMGVPDGE